MTIELAFGLGFFAGVGAWCIGTAAFVWWAMRDDD
jgi:hypothetical protein